MISPKNSSFKISVGIRNVTDFSPFGVELKGRNFEVVGGGNYRFGFQSYEVDHDVKGNGNSYTTEFRQYDPRLGKWLSVDLKTSSFPWQSPYISFDNNPISLRDPKGLEAEENGDKLPQNADGTRSKDNGNGTKTFDAPGFSTITIPNRAKILGTMQDADGNGKIDFNGKQLQASQGDLRQFNIDGIIYTATFSKGKFMGYNSKNGLSYINPAPAINTATQTPQTSKQSSVSSTVNLIGDPIKYDNNGSQVEDAYGTQFEAGFAFVGGMSVYTGFITDYTGKTLFFKGNSGNIGIGVGAGVTNFVVYSKTDERFTVDKFLGRGEAWSGGLGPFSGGIGGTYGEDKYRVISFGLGKGEKAAIWWSGSTTTSW